MSTEAAPAEATVVRAGPDQPSLFTRLAYGVGAVANGVKDNGLSYFLLLFYSQVIGVDSRLVSLALTLALVIDAFIDPVIGYWSDNLHSRWGRRHPFMYAAAAPVAIAYFLIWNPPVGWSEAHLFVYLLGTLIAIRVCFSLYEIPANSLAPELTSDYDGRSSLQAFRSYFGWTGGNAMSVFMFGVLFPLFVTKAIPNGQFNPKAYGVYGAIAAGLIFIAILATSAGTHSRIPHLKAPPPKRKIGVIGIFREIFETLSNRSFIALFTASVFGSIASGLSASMAFLLYTYFWKFTSQQASLITSGVFLSAVIGAVLAPIISKTIGKKKGAIIIGLIAFLGSPLPIVLRLSGILPAVGSDFNFWLVFWTTVFDVGLIICYQVLSGAMMADLVEQAEVRTGRRSEGVFFAASAFIGKVVNGAGIIIAGLILATAGLAKGADPASVPEATVLKMGMLYAPTIVTLWMIMLGVMSTYSITRDGHEANLRLLAERKSRELDATLQD
jgi:Na+/melibiose symporter-like transporter